MDPPVPNYGEAGHGPELVPGMCFAVEPMINLGTAETSVLDDEWTVITGDGRSSAHFEHTFAVTEDGPWVLTALDGGAARGSGAATRGSRMALNPEMRASDADRDRVAAALREHCAQGRITSTS